MRVSVRPSVALFSRYLWYRPTFMDFTFVNSAFWENDELFSFWGQKFKGQGSSMTKYAKTNHRV